LIASYTIGKEKVFLEVARRCQMPICVTAAKKAILDLVDWGDYGLPFEDTFTCDPSKTFLHAIPWNWLGETWPFFRPNYTNMEAFAAMCAAI
jgi:DNA ligase 1